MSIYKSAVVAGISQARQKVASADEWGSDNTADLLGSVLGGPIYSAIAAPGGRHAASFFRPLGRGLLEGTAGALVGGGVGGGLGAALGHRDLQLAQALGNLGRAAGFVHGQYASRRNIRDETGDYSTFGNGPDKASKSGK